MENIGNKQEPAGELVIDENGKEAFMVLEIDPDDFFISNCNNSGLEMLNSMKIMSDESRDDKFEWYGYIRGLRDSAYLFGILGKTNLQAYLEEAGEIIKDCIDNK